MVMQILQLSLLVESWKRESADEALARIITFPTLTNESGDSVTVVVVKKVISVNLLTSSST